MDTSIFDVSSSREHHSIIPNLCNSCGTFKSFSFLSSLKDAQFHLNLSIKTVRGSFPNNKKEGKNDRYLSKKKQRMRNRSRAYDRMSIENVSSVDKKSKKDVTSCKEDNILIVRNDVKSDDMYDTYRTILSVKCKRNHEAETIEFRKDDDVDCDRKEKKIEERDKYSQENGKIDIGQKIRAQHEPKIKQLISDKSNMGCSNLSIEIKDKDFQGFIDHQDPESEQSNSQIVDLTEEDCWKQNTSKDKNPRNINKITRYGVGYKKCSSHNSNFQPNSNIRGRAKYGHQQYHYNGYQRNYGYQSNKHHYNTYQAYNQCRCAQRPNKPNVTCSNCGCYGHLYRNCNYPITSYGIICFRLKTDAKTDTITPEFLMVQRHKSLNYVEFMRGKWTLENKKYLMEMFENMTEEERTDIGTHSFQSLWKALWKVDEINNYDREYRESKYKFDYLKKGYLYETKDGSRIFINIEYILENTTCTIIESEWGFPKGKRLNEKESDFNCAMREFVEETSIVPKYIEVKSLTPYEEEFIGSNKVRYKHVYYLTHCTTNDDAIAFTKDISQMVDIDEIRNVRWFKYTDGINIIRDPNQKRKEIFKQAHAFVIENIDVRQRLKV